MKPIEEKAQSVTWSNPNKDLFEERASFKKKKKYVYLDKYEDTVRELREDIMFLKSQQIKLWIGIGVVVTVLFMKILNVI
jgi:hypothetical protein